MEKLSYLVPVCLTQPATLDNHLSSSGIDVTFANEAGQSWATFECRVDFNIIPEISTPKVTAQYKKLILTTKEKSGGTSWDDNKMTELGTVNMSRQRRRTPLEFFSRCRVNYAWWLWLTPMSRVALWFTEILYTSRPSARGVLSRHVSNRWKILFQCTFKVSLLIYTSYINAENRTNRILIKKP